MPRSQIALGALTSFIGRKREIRQVRALMNEARLVTLAGPGGCGKTRLAMEVAASVPSRFPDGIAILELAPLTEARLIAEAIAATLDVHQQPGRPLSATLSDYLRPRKLLLVLDNCEHLVAEVASLTDALLRTCRDLSVLATSRMRLGIDGEHVWMVPELTPSEAVALFSERAALTRKDFAGSPESTTTIQQICGRLDGMPLAIELAAARVRTLTPGQINDRLGDRFALLTASSRTSVKHQHSLEATMSWSYDLLPEPAQQLWQRLSVFAGGFPLEAAEEICSGDSLPERQIVDALTTLIDSSIVQVSDRDSSRRYSMLETVRAYGQKRLAEASEDETYRRRHLEWFLALAKRAEPEWRGPDQARWIGRVADELDNVRAALDYSRRSERLIEQGLQLVSALWLMWHARGYIGEGRQWLSSLLELAPASAARAYGLNVAGFMAYVQGDAAAAVPLLEESLRLNEARRDQAGSNFSLLRLGIGLYYNNASDRAIATLDEALARYRAANDRIGIYVAAYELAEALTMAGDLDRAEALHAESLTLKEQQGDAWHLAQSYFGLGLLAWRRQQYPEAIARLRQSIELHQKLLDSWGLARSLEALAWVEAERGDLTRAAHLMGAAASILERASTALSPNYRLHHERFLGVVRAGLSESGFRAAWDRGHGMQAEEAGEFALHEGPPRTRRPTGGVTRREHEIARLVADGLTNRQIARQLSLAERTVDAHVEHLMNKLGYRSRAQIAAWVTRQSPSPLAGEGRGGG